MDSTIIVALIGAGALLLAPIMNDMSKKLFINPSPSYENDGKIDNFIFYLRHKYGCQRMSVIAYHNGGIYYTGKSIDKCTVKHESVDNTTQPLIHIMQGITTTFLKEMPDILKKNGILFEYDIMGSHHINKPAYFEVMRQYGTSSSIAFAVYKDIFKWNKLRYEKEMIYTIHLDWKSNEWIRNISLKQNEKINLIQDISLLSDMLEPSRVKTPENIEYLNNLSSFIK